MATCCGRVKTAQSDNSICSPFELLYFEQECCIQLAQPFGSIVQVITIEAKLRAGCLNTTIRLMACSTMSLEDSVAEDRCDRWRQRIKHERTHPRGNQCK